MAKTHHWQFIKKAFKLACLSYQSSKVKYQNADYTREELLFKRQLAVDTTEALSVEGLQHAIAEEEMRLNLLEINERQLRPDLSQHLRQSYSPINRAAVLNNLVVADSRTTSAHLEPRNRMSFRDINNSTVKLDDGQPDQKVRSNMATPPSIQLFNNGKQSEEKAGLPSKMHEIDGKRDSDATEITNEQNLMNNKIYSRRG